MTRKDYWKDIMRHTYTLTQLQQAAEHGINVDPKFLEADDYAYAQAAQELLRELN